MDKRKLLCKECNGEFEISNRAYGERIKKNRPLLCKKCFRAFLNEEHSEWYDKLPEEEKEKNAKRIKTYWENNKQ